MLKSIPKQDYLAALKGRILLNRQMAETVFLPLDREQHSWQPKRSEWSVDQCFQHLVLSFEGFVPNTAAALNKPEPAGSDGIFRPTWLARKTMGRQFDPKTKTSTVKKFNPPAAYSPNIVGRFLDQQDRLLEMVERAAEADLQAKCWIIKGLPIRYNLGDYLNLFVSHDELHLDQARRVLAAYRDWVENGMYLGAAPDLEPAG